MKIYQHFLIGISSHEIAQVVLLHNKCMHILRVIPLINSQFEEKHTHYNIEQLSIIPSPACFMNESQRDKSPFN